MPACSASFGLNCIRRLHFAALLSFVLWAGLPVAPRAQTDATFPGDLAPPADPGLPKTGELRITRPDGAVVGICPLTHTDVQADIIGFIARVKVKQSFTNQSKEKIEATYVFPLPHDAAVDGMTMMVGDRRIVGQIKPRDEARATFEAARANGNVAALLDQERPNIFTQSLTNIEPGARIDVEITYDESLRLEEDGYRFVFPMVVGPRYIPGTKPAADASGKITGTTLVPDAARISPPMANSPLKRAGHDVSLAVNIDAGSELHDIKSVLHKVDIAPQGNGRARVTLANSGEIPNRDFILNYRIDRATIANSFYLDNDARGTFFTLILQPPRRVAPAQAMPKEMIFVIDRSGSMSGAPLRTAAEAMKQCIQAMNPNDTFNLLSFSNEVDDYMGGAVPNTPENRATALKFLDEMQSGGGTNMIPSLDAALGPPPQDGRLRVVCFMTDGFVGNDMSVLDVVRKNVGNARLFSFGVGNSVNRYLLENMAKLGRGDSEFVQVARGATGRGAAVTIDTTATTAAAAHFAERIQSPVLSDISIDWGRLEVEEVYPQHIPDVFSHTPIVVHGRLKKNIAGTITLRGQTGDGTYTQQIAVSPTLDKTPHEVLPMLWARAKVENLVLDNLVPIQQQTAGAGLKEKITAVGTEYGIMTQYTSFVAVEEMTVTIAGESKKIAVPVEVPDGMTAQSEGKFERENLVRLTRANSLTLGIAAGVPPATGGGGGGGAGWGFGGAGAAMGGNAAAAGRGGRRGGAAAGGAGRAAGAGEVYRLSEGAAQNAQSLGRVEQLKESAASARLKGTPPPAAAAAQAQLSADRGAVAPNGSAGTAMFSLSDGMMLDVAGKPATPADKLAPALRGLAAAVAKDGKAGSLTSGKLKVIDYKIDVIVHLGDASAATLKALKDAGFALTAEMKSARAVIGSVDVRKLEALAGLGAVIGIEPAAQ